MAKSNKGMSSAIELLRRGGTLLKEPCPKCKGVQVKYKDRVVCVVCSNVDEVLKEETVSAEATLSNLREMIVQKIKQTSSLLNKENDLQKQGEITTLLIKYLELLEKVKRIRS